MFCDGAEAMLTIGSMRLWFPSRRSVESHLGTLSTDLEGH